MIFSAAPDPPFPGRLKKILVPPPLPLLSGHNQSFKNSQNQNTSPHRFFYFNSLLLTDISHTVNPLSE